MDYKRIIRSQKARFFILRCLDWVPDKIMLSIQYRIKMGRRLNLNNPLRWTEKIQLYKMAYRNPILSECVDKYAVRQYVEKKGLKDILVNNYGVFDSVDDVPFDSLPHSFVIKTTGGGGGQNVVIIKDKESYDLSSLKKRLEYWLRSTRTNGGREWAYSGIQKPRIIIDELLVDLSKKDGSVDDFKFLCFSGEPKFVIVDKDRYSNHRRNFYTTEWRRVNVTTDHEQFDEDYSKPQNFTEMLNISRVLSHDFPFVRVDLYNVNGRICFGELTFYPWSGYVQFTPDEFDFELGRLMIIPKN